MTEERKRSGFWADILVIILIAFAITGSFALVVAARSYYVVQQPTISTDKWRDISSPQGYITYALYDVTHELRGIRIQLDRLNTNLEILTEKIE